VIDPITIGAALTGIQKAVSLVKQAAKTAQDVGSLAPMVADLFDAKHKATVAMVEGKKAGGSNLGLAMKIEVALMESATIEKELQMLFFMSGKADVWEKIKSREAAMNKDDKYAAKAAEDRAKKLKEEQEEFMIVALVIVLLIVLFGGGYYVVSDIVETAKKEQHGHKHKN